MNTTIDLSDFYELALRDCPHDFMRISNSVKPLRNLISNYKSNNFLENLGESLPINNTMLPTIIDKIKKDNLQIEHFDNSGLLQNYSPITYFLKSYNKKKGTCIIKKKDTADTNIEEFYTDLGCDRTSSIFPVFIIDVGGNLMTLILNLTNSQIDDQYQFFNIYNPEVNYDSASKIGTYNVNYYKQHPNNAKIHSLQSNTFMNMTNGGTNNYSVNDFSNHGFISKYDLILEPTTYFLTSGSKNKMLLRTINHLDFNNNSLRIESSDSNIGRLSKLIQKNIDVNSNSVLNDLQLMFLQAKRAGDQLQACSIYNFASREYYAFSVGPNGDLSTFNTQTSIQLIPWFVTEDSLARDFALLIGCNVIYSSHNPKSITLYKRNTPTQLQPINLNIQPINPSNLNLIQQTAGGKNLNNKNKKIKYQKGGYDYDFNEENNKLINFLYRNSIYDIFLNYFNNNQEFIDNLADINTADFTTKIAYLDNFVNINDLDFDDYRNIIKLMLIKVICEENILNKEEQEFFFIFAYKYNQLINQLLYYDSSDELLYKLLFYNLLFEYNVTLLINNDLLNVLNNLKKIISILLKNTIEVEVFSRNDILTKYRSILQSSLDVITNEEPRLFSFLLNNKWTMYLDELNGFEYLNIPKAYVSETKVYGLERTKKKRNFRLKQSTPIGIQTDLRGPISRINPLGGKKIKLKQKQIKKIKKKTNKKIKKKT